MIRSVWLLMCIVILLPSWAWAGTIKKLNTPKKLALIDEGSDQGLQKKTRICFYEAGTKVGCGIVRSVKAKSAVVAVRSDKTFGKLKEGMETRVEPLPGAGSATDQATAGGTTKDPGAAGKESARHAKAAKNYVAGFGIFPLVNPVTYSNLIYKTPLGQAVTSMWDVDSPVGTLGGGLELGFGISSYVLTVGARTRIYRPRRIASDYSDGDNDDFFEKYAETVATGSSFGAYLDFYYLSWQWGVTGLHLGNGLDFDSTNVTFTMEQKDDDAPEVLNKFYEATSKLTALSLRTNLILDFNFGSLGLKIGTIFTIPLSQSPSFSAKDSTDPFLSNLQGKTLEEDIKSSLGHKAQFGAEILLGAYFSY